MKAIAHTGIALLLALAIPTVAGEEQADDGAGIDAAPIRVIDAQTTPRDGIHYLDANIEFNLADELFDALKNGVALNFEINIEIRQERVWLRNRTITTLNRSYRLEYHALSGRHLITDPVIGVTTAFSNPVLALDIVGTIRDLALIEDDLLDDKASYTVHLRGRLVSDALPVPLRIRGLLDETWRAASDWYTWPLR